MTEPSLLHLRTLLFVPGNRPERFDKAFDSGADAVCMDLEDAVGKEDKTGAREAVAAALASPQRVPPALVRINAADSQWYEKDVQKLSSLPPTVAIVLPKASLGQIQALTEKTGTRPLIALLENAASIEEAYAIAGHETVTALMLGGGDLMAELGGQLSWEPLFYARSRLLMAAVSAGCLAIDVPCLNLRDTAVIEEETRAVKALGYACKAAIHPAQIAPIHRALAPSDEEIIEAREMLAASRAATGDAVSWRGKMLDEAVIIMAERVLRLAGEHSDHPQ